MNMTKGTVSNCLSEFHQSKNRSFRQRPSDFVINGNTPSITPKNAVTRFQEIEYNEYDCGNTAHYQQEYIETPR